MKKTIIAAAIAAASLVGCGVVDSVEPDKPSLPLKEETTTSSGTTPVTTSSDEEDESTTTVSTATNKKVTAATTSAKTAVTRASQATRKPVTRATTTAKTTTAAVTTSTQPAYTTIVTTAEPAVTTTMPQDPTNLEKDNLTCKVKPEGVEISRDGEVIQLIDVDTQQMLSFYEQGVIDPSTIIWIVDFDFDGHPDLFIPENIGTYNTAGKYWHCSPESGAFTEWEEMSDIEFIAAVDEETKVLSVHGKISATDFEDKHYRWEDGSLVLFSSEMQYAFDPPGAEPPSIYVDYYEYENGEKKTVKREQLILNEKQEIIGRKEIAIEWIMR